VADWEARVFLPVVEGRNIRGYHEPLPVISRVVWPVGTVERFRFGKLRISTRQSPTGVNLCGALATNSSCDPELLRRLSGKSRIMSILFVGCRQTRTPDTSSSTGARFEGWLQTDPVCLFTCSLPLSGLDLVISRSDGV